jgi:hypothetical protein
MTEHDKNFEETEDQVQEVTELDDQALEDASGGTFSDTETTINENCGVC